MNIKKIVKLAILPASLLALSQTGLPSAMGDALTPAAVAQTAQTAQTTQTAQTAGVATTAATAEKAAGDGALGEGWGVIPGIPSKP